MTEIGSGDLLVLSGNANRPLAENIASYLDQEVGDAYVGRFVDGEVRVAIKSSVRDRDVYVVQPTGNSPEVGNSPMDNLGELCIMTDALKRASAKRVTAVMPYYGHARQDRKDQPRVPITAKWVAEVLTVSGVDQVLTLDLHADQIQGFFSPEVQIDHLVAAPRIFLPHIRAKGLDGSVIGCPDIGGVKLMKYYADQLDAEKVVIDKDRQNDTNIEVTTILGKVAGENVILVDDICSTAGTLCGAADTLKEAGAKDVYAAITHGVLCGPALERIHDSAIKELWITDTIHRSPDQLPSNISVLSAANLVGEGIRRLHTGESISELYDEPA